VQVVGRGDVAFVVSNEVELVWVWSVWGPCAVLVTEREGRHTFGKVGGQGCNVEDGAAYAMGEKVFDHAGADALGAASNDGNLLVPVPSASVVAPQPPVLSPAVQHGIEVQHGAKRAGPFQVPIEGGEWQKRR